MAQQVGADNAASAACLASDVVRNQMKTETQRFCDAVRARSQENRTAIGLLGHSPATLSPAMSILRQELDSMVRVIWLLALESMSERERLIQATFSGQKWKRIASNGRQVNITDRDMVELAQELQGWSKSVYKFGCAFIHLSDFHEHSVQDPFRKLPQSEKDAILSHMRSYHGGPIEKDPDLLAMAPFIPKVFDKIADNLECYLEHLEKGEMIT